MKGVNSIVLTFIKLLIILYYNIDSVQGIQGGHDKPIGELTYHVAILIDDQYACGGAIMGPRHVISAGQCVMDLRGNFLDVTIKILYGIYDGWAVRSAIKVMYVYTLKEFRMLGTVPRYFPDILEIADLSILQTEAELPFEGPFPVSRVVFPRRNHGRFLKFTKQIANITGYGIDISMSYDSASNLTNLPDRRNMHADMKYLSVYIETADFCFNHYREVQSSHLCAISTLNRTDIGPIPTGACLGDVGGPLVRNNEVIGVLQIFVNGCDDRRIPALYTRITTYKDFVDAALNGTYLDTMRIGNYTGAYVREVFL